MDNPIQFVLAGLGWWGRSWIPHLEAHPRVRFVATVDPSNNPADWARENLKTPHFPDLESALSALDADAVLVTTPPKLHRPVVVEALAHGKHVLVEKPLVTNREDGMAIERAAANSSGRVMVGQGYRFMDSAKFLRHALDSETIGDLQAIRILFRQFVPDLLERTHPLYALPHSILIDMANHHFDLIRYITRQEIARVLALEHRTPDNAFDYPSNALCILRLGYDIPVIWDGDWCNTNPRTTRTAWEGEWEIIGSNGRLFWRAEPDPEYEELFRPFICLQRPRSSPERLAFEETVLDRRVPVLDHFVEAISRGAQPQPGVEDNLKMLGAVFACIDSINQKREVACDGAFL
jgi:predicted dehydrogenase